MKILIAYSSLTGNTKKIAQAIHQIAGGDLIDIRDKPDFKEYDAIVIGYWADKGKADKLADDFLKEVNNKPCGVFATLGAYPDSPHAQKVISYGIETLENQGCKILSSFICQGKIDPTLTKRFESLEPGHPHYMDEARRKRHEDAKSHPDERDLAMAQEAFKDFREKAKGAIDNGRPD